MELDAIAGQLVQPTLFEIGEATSGAVELFPAVWSAAEMLFAPEVAIRQQGISRLVELGAARLSPLIASLLAVRLTDPDLEIRRQIAHILGDLLSADTLGQCAPEQVRQYLTNTLGQMRQRPIFALLEVAISDPSAEQPIARLFNACPYAGRHLGDIITERKHPLAVRRMAIHYVGLVGYLEAIPALERMSSRLETRLTGQQAMPFAPPLMSDELDLLPEVRLALANLHAP